MFVRYAAVFAMLTSAFIYIYMKCDSVHIPSKGTIQK